MSPTRNPRRLGTSRAAPSSRASAAPTRVERREVLIRAGLVAIRARLLDTATASRVWSALPIYGTAETWGAAVHIETPVETGREPGARALIEPGEIAFWSEDDRIIIGFGLTPLSRPGEIRLPVPCNVWARALDDVTQLAAVRPGERAAVLMADS